MNERREKGLGFAGREAVLKTKPGARPKRTKSSDRNSHRPRVLSVCHERRHRYKERYFKLYFAYKAASEEYRGGKLDAQFPEDTDKPPFKEVAPP